MSTAAKSRMARTVRTPRPRRDYSASDAVCRDLALQWGRRPSTVRQMLHGRHRLDRLTTDVIEAMQRHDADDRLARWSAPIRAALAGVRMVPLSRQLLRDRQMDDIAEDQAEEEFRLVQNPETAKGWVRKIDAEISSLMTLRKSLVAEFGLEPGS